MLSIEAETSTALSLKKCLPPIKNALPLYSISESTALPVRGLASDSSIVICESNLYVFCIYSLSTKVFPANSFASLTVRFDFASSILSKIELKIDVPFAVTTLLSSHSKLVYSKSGGTS